VRKRIIIGLLAVVVSGAVAFFVSQPKKGTVEWHKREYLEVRDQLLGRTWKDAARRFCARVTNASIFQQKRESRTALWAIFHRHEKALIDLGFLEKRTLFFQSYWTHFPFGMQLLPRYEGMSVYARGDYGTGASQIVLIGLPDDMPKWEEWTRQMERKKQKMEELLQQMERQKQGGTTTN
jgi:hypothetical protein